MEDIDIILNRLGDMKISCTPAEKTWENAFITVFSKIKSDCEKEVMMHKENNTGLSDHIENFSEKILRSIVAVKKNIEIREIGQKANFEMLDRLINDFSKIKQDRTADTKERITSSGEKIRKVGERPLSQKEKRGKKES